MTTAADTDIAPRGLGAHGQELVEYLIRAGYQATVTPGAAGFAWVIWTGDWLPVDGGVMGTAEGAWGEIADWAESRVLVPALAGDITAEAVTLFGHGREAFAAAYAGVAISAAFRNGTGD
jgi:hypothetical protein